MPATPIQNFGAGGVVKDTPAVQLPENVVTDALNMRWVDNGIETMKGESLYKNLTSAQADYGIHWRRPDQGYNIFLRNGTAVRVDAAGNESFMLNSAASGYNNSVWQSDYFNGGYAVIINNGKSTPLYALFGHPTAGSSFQPFPGWNYVSGLTVTAKVVRSIGYSLVAANLTLTRGATITNAPSTIRVSVQAAPGQFPQIWQPGLTTDTADEFEVNSTSPILDMAELRGNMFIYSSDSIHILSIRGGVSQVAPYAKDYGILNTNCVTEFNGQHFVVDRNDIYTHNGSGSFKPIAEERVKKYFFNNLNKAQYQKVFVVKQVFQKEIWVCYPKGTATECTEALVYNYAKDAWYPRQLPNIRSIFRSFDTTGSVFDYSTERLIGTTTLNRVFKMEDTYLMWNGTTFASYASYIRRDKLFNGNALGSVYVESLTPIISSSDTNAVINIVVTGQNSPNAVPDFSNTSGRDGFQYIPSDPDNQSRKVDPRTTGRFLNYLFTSTSPWRMELLGIFIKPADRR